MCYKSVILLLTIFIFECSCQDISLKQVVSNKECQYDTDCWDNSFCYENDSGRKGYCKCKDGFVLIKRNSTTTPFACLPNLKHGESCEDDLQCQINLGSLAKCVSTCTCPEGTHRFNNTTCYETKRLYDTCLYAEQCLLNGERGYCTLGICDCPANQRATLDRTACVVGKNLEDSCSSDSDCALIENSVCQQVCSCKPNYAVSRNRKFCIQDATKFGDSCVEDAQCSKLLLESVCTNSTCTCRNQKHGVGLKCYLSKNLNEDCSVDQECEVSADLEGIVSCTDAKCVCKYGNSTTTTGIECNKDNSSTTYFVNYILVLFSLCFLLLK